MDQSFSQLTEPFASPPIERIKALKKVSEAGIRTYVFASPIWPGITNIKNIISAAPFADYFMFENLNIRPSNRENVFATLKMLKPKLIPLYEEIYSRNYSGKYWAELQKEIRLYKPGAHIFFHHGGFKKQSSV